MSDSNISDGIQKHVGDMTDSSTYTSYEKPIHHESMTDAFTGSCDTQNYAEITADSSTYIYCETQSQQSAISAASTDIYDSASSGEEETYMSVDESLFSCSSREESRIRQDHFHRTADQSRKYDGRVLFQNYRPKGIFTEWSQTPDVKIEQDNSNEEKYSTYFYDLAWSEKLIQGNSSRYHEHLPKTSQQYEKQTGRVTSGIDPKNGFNVDRNEMELSILRGRKREKVKTLNNLHEGDAIAFVRAGGLYKHHAIVKHIWEPGNIFKVIELSGDSGDLIACSSSVGPKANVSEKALIFGQCRKIYRYMYPRGRDDGVHPIDVARVLFNYGLPQNYTFLKFNCEHFVSYCITGIPFSKQADRYTESVNPKAKKVLDEHVHKHINNLSDRKPSLPKRPSCYLVDGSENVYIKKGNISDSDKHQYSSLSRTGKDNTSYESHVFDEYGNYIRVPEPDYPGYLTPVRRRCSRVYHSNISDFLY